jgi:hypothetical protein
MDVSAANFAVSRALEVVFRVHAVPTFCTAGACPQGNSRIESIQWAWAGGALRTMPATTQPTIWHPISWLLHPGGLFGLLAGYQSRPICIPGGLLFMWGVVSSFQFRILVVASQKTQLQYYENGKNTFHGMKRKLASMAFLTILRATRVSYMALFQQSMP